MHGKNEYEFVLRIHFELVNLENKLLNLGKINCFNIWE